MHLHVTLSSWQTIFGNKGINNLVVKVEHCGIDDQSKIFEQEINAVVNRVYKREFTGQPSTFFLSTIRIACYHQKLAPFLDFIGEVKTDVIRSKSTVIMHNG
jgi:hypothetical protein